jgi:hypothetical protein
MKKALIEDIIELENGEIGGDEAAVAMQRTINDGSAWKFQGSWGRSMMDAIQSGRAMLGINRSIDYYGNVIPSRSEVAPDSRGSYGYVVNAMGTDYALMLEAA